MNTSNNTSSTGRGNILGQMKSLFQIKDSVSPVKHMDSPTSTKTSGESYREWGVRLSGSSGGNVVSLPPALQSCYWQNVKEQESDKDLQEKNQKALNVEITQLKGKRDSTKILLNNEEQQKEKLNQEIKDHRNKIDEIKSGDSNDIMATVQFYIGTIITILLAVYLFVFYSSASFSAFFDNQGISAAGQAIFNPRCFSDALNNGLGQLLLILLMPVIFLALGFLIHQFGENDKTWTKYIKIGSLYLVTFIFDGLLAFEISQKVFINTVLTEDVYTVSMAFNSPNFWIVIFAGFVAYVIWGLVFDFTLQHFDNMNSHTREIQVLQNKIATAQQTIKDLEAKISQMQAEIKNIEAKISSLEMQLQESRVIDRNVLKHALSEFFNGWLAYMQLAAKSESEKVDARQFYDDFILKIEDKETSSKSA